MFYFISRNVKPVTVAAIAQCVNEQYVWNTLLGSVSTVYEKLKSSWTKIKYAQNRSVMPVCPEFTKLVIKIRTFNIFGIEINSRTRSVDRLPLSEQILNDQ